MRLRVIVGCPFLLISLLDRDRFGDGLGLGFFVKSEFALDHVLNRKDVFATKLPTLKIGTTAMRLCGVGFDRIVHTAARALRWNKPSLAIIGALKFRSC